jgi:hypothetical protein
VPGPRQAVSGRARRAGLAVWIGRGARG